MCSRPTTPTFGLSIKNFKSFIGLEGHGFNANLYMGTAKLATIIEDASGSIMLNIQWTDKASEAIVKNIVDALPLEKCPADAEGWEKTLYDETGHRKVKMDDYLNALVNDHELAIKRARKEKTYIIFSLPDRKGFFEVKHNGEVARMRTAMEARYPGIKFEPRLDDVVAPAEAVKNTAARMANEAVANSKPTAKKPAAKQTATRKPTLEELYAQATPHMTGGLAALQAKYGHLNPGMQGMQLAMFIRKHA